MLWRNTAAQYGIIAKAFHWLIALLVIMMIALGLYMEDQDPSPFVFKLFALHKSIGITILALVSLRLFWRYLGPRPLALPNHKPWEKKLARWIHVFLYLSLFLMPLSGWIMSSAKDFSVSFFGLFVLPDIVSPNKDIADFAKEVHEVTAYALIAAIGLHFIGALKHHVIDRDSTLRRMLPVVAVVLFTFGPSAAMAENPQAWTILQDQSALHFEAVQMGAPFEGKFTSFNGTILFDPDNLPASKVDIMIDIGSIDATSEDRNKYLPMDDWFSTQRFPSAQFVTKKISRGLDINQYIAEGSLTLRDVTLPVMLPFTVNFSKDGATNEDIATMSGETTINRLDFGIGQGQWTDTKTVGAEVRVRVDLKAVHKK